MCSVKVVLFSFISLVNDGLLMIRLWIFFWVSRLFIVVFSVWLVLFRFLWWLML